MQTLAYTLNSLFQQLGLDHDDEAIEKFIRLHSPLPDEQQLSDAEFWSPAQSEFLKEALAEDSEWCDVVDTLDTQLRG